MSSARIVKELDSSDQPCYTVYSNSTGFFSQWPSKARAEQDLRFLNGKRQPGPPRQADAVRRAPSIRVSAERYASLQALAAAGGVSVRVALERVLSGL